jgi:phage replication O-like protein O
MASPQVENGHTDIANELLEALAWLQLSGYQWRLLCVILRLTYGWHKKVERISLSTFAEKTGIPTKHISPVLQDLVSRKIITKDTTTYITTYGLQKNWEKWLTTPEIGSPQNGREALLKSGGELLPKSGDIKENKETSKKKEALRASFDVFYKAYPKKKARRDAERAWAKLNPSSELQPVILTALERQKQSEDWKRDKGKYIPYPATWLNGRRWEDEISEVKNKWTS